MPLRYFDYNLELMKKLQSLFQQSLNLFMQKLRSGKKNAIKVARNELHCTSMTLSTVGAEIFAEDAAVSKNRHLTQKLVSFVCRTEMSAVLTICGRFSPNLNLKITSKFPKFEKRENRDPEEHLVKKKTRNDYRRAQGKATNTTRSNYDTTCARWQ